MVTARSGCHRATVVRILNPLDLFISVDLLRIKSKLEMVNGDFWSDSNFEYPYNKPRSVKSLNYQAWSLIPVG
jgi:hypothetical protein